VNLFAFLVSSFLTRIFQFQDRLKKLKSEHGKVQLGNITVDMVETIMIFTFLVCLYDFHLPLHNSS